MDDKQRDAAEGLLALSQVQRERRADIFPEVQFEGRTLKFSRMEQREGEPPDTGAHAPDTVRMSGAGGTKRVFDLGDGRAMAMPNFDKGIGSVESAGTFLARWRDVARQESENAALMRELGFETQAYEQHKVQVGKGEIPVLVMPSFEKLAQEGKYIRDTKVAHASSGKVMLFGSKDKLESPAHVKALMGMLAEDCARIAAYGLHLSSDSYNLMVKDTPETKGREGTSGQDVVSRGQGLRLFVFDMGDWPLAENIPQPEAVHRVAERSVARMFEAVLNSVTHDELDALVKTGADRWRWDEPAQQAFAQVKDELVAQVEARVREMLPDAPRKLQDAKRAASAPPLQLPGGGSPELLTGQGRDMRRGPG